MSNLLGVQLTPLSPIVPRLGDKYTLALALREYYVTSMANFAPNLRGETPTPPIVLFMEERAATKTIGLFFLSVGNNGSNICVYGRVRRWSIILIRNISGLESTPSLVVSCVYTAVSSVDVRYVVEYFVHRHHLHQFSSTQADESLKFQSESRIVFLGFSVPQPCRSFRCPRQTKATTTSWTCRWKKTAHCCCPRFAPSTRTLVV